MRAYNFFCVENPKTRYVAAAGAYDSDFAQILANFSGSNDEFVSVASVTALPCSTSHIYVTSTNDPESQGICARLGLRNHSCLLYYSRIFDELFSLYLARLTAPLPPAGRVEGTAGPVRQDVAADLQGVGSDAAIVPADGVSQAHAVLIDAGDTALFFVVVDGNLVRLDWSAPAAGGSTRRPR